MKSEIIFIGDDNPACHALLHKIISDTGIVIEYTSTIEGAAVAIDNAIATARTRSPFIFLVGGLDPQKEQLTKSAIARLLNVPLTQSAKLSKHITNLCKISGVPVGEKLQELAMIPRGCNPILLEKLDYGIIAPLEMGLLIALPDTIKESCVVTIKSVLLTIATNSNRFLVPKGGEPAKKKPQAMAVQSQENPPKNLYERICFLRKNPETAQNNAMGTTFLAVLFIILGILAALALLMFSVYLMAEGRDNPIFTLTTFSQGEENTPYSSEYADEASVAPESSESSELNESSDIEYYPPDYTSAQSITPLRNESSTSIAPPASSKVLSASPSSVPPPVSSSVPPPVSSSVPPPVSSSVPPPVSSSVPPPVSSSVPPPVSSSVPPPVSSSVPPPVSSSVPPPVSSSVPPPPEPEPDPPETYGDWQDTTLEILENGSVISYNAYDLICEVLQNEARGALHIEAMKAQAVAVYSYIKYNNDNGAYPSVLRNSNVSATTKKAVNAVDGLGIYYNGRIANTVYHSTSCGETTTAKSVWGRDLPYLQSVDSSLDAKSPYYSATYKISVDNFADKVYTTLGIELTDDPENWIEIDYEKLEPGGYVGPVAIGGYTTAQGGKLGRAAITGRVIREQILSFSIRSTCFDVDYDGANFVFTSRGYGHGVGMSQYGAHFLALDEGYSFEDILLHYYSGTEVY